ncbi:hypothetical protein [Cohnella sp.]|uniref:hypothetical protein n=1 Tax=Cohnella sp. TaxID=1883426 RepID=UPI003703A434
MKIRKSKTQTYADMGQFRPSETKSNSEVGEIKEWRMTPDQIAAYVPGMDLGKPDKIVSPETLKTGGKIHPVKVAPDKSVDRFSSFRKLTIGKEEYLKLIDSGVTQAEIAAKYNVTVKHLQDKVREWRRK